MKSIRELKEKLLKLKREEMENGERIYSIYSHISELEDEAIAIGDRSEYIVKEIEELERQLAEIAFKELDNNLTGDKFKDSFIKASYFCKQDNLDEKLAYVEINEDRLIALNGYMGIILKCDEIPRELQNSYIRYDVRDNFQEEAEKRRKYGSIDLEKFIEDTKNDNVHSNIIDINVRDFMNKFFCRIVKNEFIVLKYNNLEVAFNEKYLDMVIKLFGQENVKVYYSMYNVNPLILESLEQKVVLFPVRLNELD